jgi:hypothetical protein
MAHYYAVLIAAPIAVGEIVRQVLRRRIDWKPWIALVAAGVLWLPLGILISAGAPACPGRGLVIRIRGVYEFLPGRRHDQRIASRCSSVSRRSRSSGVCGRARGRASCPRMKWRLASSASRYPR